jgi:hypothetical protein
VVQIRSPTARSRTCPGASAVSQKADHIRARAWVVGWDNRSAWIYGQHNPAQRQVGDVGSFEVNAKSDVGLRILALLSGGKNLVIAAEQRPKYSRFSLP